VEFINLAQWLLFVDVFIITLIVAIGIELLRLNRDLNKKIDDIMEQLKTKYSLNFLFFNNK
jgi:hypothetical protein